MKCSSCTFSILFSVWACTERICMKILLLVWILQSQSCSDLPLSHWGKEVDMQLSQAMGFLEKQFHAWWSSNPNTEFCASVCIRNNLACDFYCKTWCSLTNWQKFGGKKANVSTLCLLLRVFFSKALIKVKFYIVF